MNKNLEIKLDNQYDLYEKDYKFQFKNPENVIYFGDTFPENATLKDIFEGKAIPYVKLPINLLQSQSLKERIQENTNEIEALKKRIAELEALALDNKS